MENQIVKARFNEDGNQIISESENGGVKTQTIKFGMIRLIGKRMSEEYHLRRC